MESGPQRALSSPTATSGLAPHYHSQEPLRRNPAAIGLAPLLLPPSGLLTPSRESPPAAQQPSSQLALSEVPAGGDKEIITLTVWGCKMVQHEKQIWFHQRNDIKADVVVHQTALKEDDPRKYL